MTSRPAYLKPLLIVTTIIHGLVITLGLLAAALFSFGMLLMFNDTPGGTSGSFLPVFLLIALLVVLVPVAFTATQWILYSRGRDRAALVVSLIGVAPLLLSMLSSLRS